MTTRVVTTDYRVGCAERFIESIDNTHTYYLWMGQTPPVAVTPNVYDDTIDTSVDVYRNMSIGKRVQNSDASLMIRNVPYVANTIYAQYDDGDPILFSRDFYVVVNAGSFHHVFKCLDNNNNQPSTVSPNFSDVDSADAFYQTSDGYVWKYMYSIEESIFEKFQTSSSYVPLTPNTDVITLAADGSFDNIVVENAGGGYANYLDSIFSSADIKINGNTVLYGLSGNTNVSPINDFYAGCNLYISTGQGAGQSRLITQSFSDSTGRYVVLDSQFLPPPVNGCQYQIRPSVRVISDGSETQECIARALITTGNNIARIEILQRGEGYQTATAEVVASTVVNVTEPASIRPIYSPPGGHGFNPGSELCACAVAVAVTVDGNESNTLPNGGQYRQVGLLRDPLFANVSVQMSNTVGTFLPGEQIARLSTVKLLSSCIVSGNTVSNAYGYFDQQLNPGDTLLLQTADDTFQSVVTVDQVSAPTTVNLTSNVLWACSVTDVFKATVLSTSTLQAYANSFAIILDDVDDQITNGDTLVGMSSGAKCVISGVLRSGMFKSFDTFIQMDCYTGTYSTGQFNTGDVVYQGVDLPTSTANACVYASQTINGVTTVYFTNIYGQFLMNSPVLTTTTSTVFTPSSKYSPELKQRSGPVIYAQNIDMVRRDLEHAESHNVILNFQQM